MRPWVFFLLVCSIPNIIKISEKLYIKYYKIKVYIFKLPKKT